MPGGLQMRDYVDANFRSCVYLGLMTTDKSGRKVRDPVTFMPFSSISMQMGECYFMDYARPYDHPLRTHPGVRFSPRLDEADWLLPRGQTRLDGRVMGFSQDPSSG